MLRRLLKVVALLGVLLVAAATVAWFTMRDEILAKVLDAAESRLVEKGLYLERSSATLSWHGGVALSGLVLYDDEARQKRIVSLTRLGIRIPLRELLKRDPPLILTADRSDLELETSAGDLRFTDLAFELHVLPGRMEIERFESRFNGLRVTAAGAMRLGEGPQSGPLTIPDLSWMVKAARWIEFSGDEPTLALNLSPRETPDGKLSVEAELRGENFSWKDLRLEQATVGVGLAEGAVILSPLALKSHGGSLTGGLVIDYRNGQLRIPTVHSTIDPFHLVASLPVGEGVAKAMGPFRSVGETSVKAQDVTFDLREFGRSSGTFEVDSPGGIAASLESGDLVLQNLGANVTMGKGALTIDGRRFDLCGGKGSGIYEIPLAGDFRYRLKFTLNGVSLPRLGKTFGVKDGLVGTMSTTFDGGGSSGVASLDGRGWVKVTGGKFYSVPVLGSLRIFLSSKSSQFGEDVAGDLEAHFTVARGMVHSSDLRIESSTTVVTATGWLNFVKDTVAVDVRANLKGVVGVATALVSKILEVRGEGPLDKVHWTLANVPKVVDGAANVVSEGAAAVGEAAKGVGEAAGKILEKGSGLRIPKKGK